MENWLVILAASLCCAGISFTVTISGMFERLRNWIYNKNKFLGELITCPWCFGHYVVFVLLLISDIQYIIVSQYVVFNFLFTSFVIIGLMGLWHKILLVAYDPVMKIKAQREINRLKIAKAKSE